MKKLQITRESDSTVLGTRHFAAPPDKIFEAHVNPDILREWCLGPDGWSMPVCESDPKPGGKIRFVWRNDSDGSEFSLTGEYQEVERPTRIVHVERMHLPDTTPDNRVETMFEPHEGGTLLTLRMTLPNAEALEEMLKAGTADGMEKSYSRLDKSV